MRKLRFPDAVGGGGASPLQAPPSVATTQTAVGSRLAANASSTPAEGRRFYDTVLELTAEYDRALAEKHDAQVEKQRLLQEVALLRSGVTLPAPQALAMSHMAAAPAVAPPSAEPPSGQLPLALGALIADEATTSTLVVRPYPASCAGLPPEPEKPSSPRAPPESPRPPMSPSAVRISPCVSIAGVKEDSASMSAQDSARPLMLSSHDEEDLGRMTNASCMSTYSRFSGETEFEEEDYDELEPLDVWTRTEEQLMTAKKSIARGLANMDVFDHQSAAELRGCQRCILRPSGRFAVGWDFFTILVLLYDLVVIPLQAYELPQMRFWSLMEFVATVTWTLDICLSFCKGFEEKGNIELRPRRIVVHYLKTWFAFDISIVAMDWVLFVFQEGDLVDWLRFSRGRRALRLLRLARLLKHGHRLLQVFSFVRSENLLVIMRIFWLLIGLVAINHFISCGWYALGTGISGHTWAEKAFDLEGTDYDLAYRYLTSFHWAVTQFTPASMEIVPQNAFERAYNILVIFFGLLMFSSFVSNMTNSMTYLTKINYEKRQRQNIARTYILAKGVSLSLANDIMRYVTVSQSLRRSLREADVMAFKTLPKRMVDHLRVEVHKPVLGTHALFSHLRANDTAVFARLCSYAVGEKAMINGEELFHLGGKATGMFFVSRGQLTYVFGYGETEQPPVDIGVKQWLSEAALWAQWEHHGRAIASSSPSDIVELNAVEFQGIAMRCLILSHLQEYAKLWAKSASFESGGREHITDIWGQRLRVSDLVQKVFNIEEDNEAQKLVRIMGGNEFTLERCFKAWAKYNEQVKQEKKKSAEEEKRKMGGKRRRGSFRGSIKGQRPMRSGSSARSGESGGSKRRPRDESSERGAQEASAATDSTPRG